MRDTAKGVYAELDELVALRHVARDMTLLPKQPVRSLLAGRRASKLRGRGLDFEELRAYVRGDDVRALDWHVTARLRKPYVRSYREERERPVVVLVDQRRSMFFGSAHTMKSVAAARVGALAAWRAVAVGDRVGAVVVRDDGVALVTPQRTTGAVLRVLGELVSASRALGAAPPGAGEGGSIRGAERDGFADALRQAGKLSPHGGLLVIVSDLRGAGDEVRLLLGELRRHNDVLLVWVVDPLEVTLPSLGWVGVSDGSTDLAVPTSDPKLRTSFAQAHAANRERILHFARETGTPTITLDPQEDVVEQIRAALGHITPGPAAAGPEPRS